MKIISFLPIGPILFLWISGSVSLYGMEVDSTGWSLVLEPGYEESYTVIGQAKAKRTLLLQEWEQRLKVETDARNLLLKFIDLQTELEQIAWNEEISLLKVRYQKGIDLIKLLYEKILSLDHHFAGMRTYQNVLLLSNPLSYPDFQQAKSLIEEKLDKKHPFSLPAIFNTNPFMTATFSVVATLIGDGDSKSKQEDLDKIACILDFTVRMSSDLGVIQHETEYLKSANQQLRIACEALFEDYVKVIAYYVPLEKCRNNDDWEALARQLDLFVDRLQVEPYNNPVAMQSSTDIRAKVDLEFATQRVADFINSYNQFITQGTQYYQKFDNILSAYDYEQDCQNQLPSQFEELKYDIKSTIEKFKNTYNLPEIQGSRMKNLLFGNFE